MVVVAAGALVCQGSNFQGEVNVGPGTVIHPGCSVLAVNGPIFIGSNNVLEERVVITNRDPIPLIIGDNNLIEVGSILTNSSIGNSNVIETKAHLDRVKVANGCRIGLGVSVAEMRVEDNISIHAPRNTQQRIDAADQANALSIARLLELLRKVLPASHVMLPTEGEPPAAAPTPSS